MAIKPIMKPTPTMLPIIIPINAPRESSPLSGEEGDCVTVGWVLFVLIGAEMGTTAFSSTKT